MASLYDADPKCLEYELSRLGKAIESVSKILIKHVDHSHALEYYSAMQETMLALQAGIDEMRRTREAYSNLYIRLENMELLLHHYLKEKDHDNDAQRSCQIIPAIKSTITG